MTSRTSARRHKGRTRMRPRAQPDQERQDRIKQAAIDDLCAPAAAASLRYWTEHLPNPLFVYFIQADHRTGPVKIGQAQDPIKRLRTLQCAHWERLTVRGLVLAGTGLESLLHANWGRAAIRGEWFGQGYEQAIATIAEENSKHQIDYHRNGMSVDDIHKITVAELLVFIWGGTHPEVSAR